MVSLPCYLTSPDEHLQQQKYMCLYVTLDRTNMRQENLLTWLSQLELASSHNNLCHGILHIMMHAREHEHAS